MLRLPCTSSGRCTKSCACQAEVAPDATKCCACQAEVTPDATKCCACHAKLAPDAKRAAPAKQKKRQMETVLRLRRQAAGFSAATKRAPELPESSSAAPATQKDSVLCFSRSSMLCTAWSKKRIPDLHDTKSQRVSVGRHLAYTPGEGKRDGIKGGTYCGI